MITDRYMIQGDRDRGEWTVQVQRRNVREVAEYGPWATPEDALTGLQHVLASTEEHIASINRMRAEGQLAPEPGAPETHRNTSSPAKLYDMWKSTERG